MKLASRSAQIFKADKALAGPFVIILAIELFRSGVAMFVEARHETNAIFAALLPIGCIGRGARRVAAGGAIAYALIITAMQFHMGIAKILIAIPRPIVGRTGTRVVRLYALPRPIIAFV